MSETGEGGRSKFKVSWKGWIALIGALGLFGLAYFVSLFEDYGYRAQSFEAFSLMVGARTPLAEYFQNHGKWPENLDNLVEHTKGTSTQSVGITKGAGGTGEIELTATMRTEGMDGRVAGKTILMLSSNGGKNWTCRAGTMPADYLPADCRH